MLSQLAHLRSEMQAPVPTFELEDSWKDIVKDYVSFKKFSLLFSVEDYQQLIYMELLVYFLMSCLY